MSDLFSDNPAFSQFAFHYSEEIRIMLATLAMSNIGSVSIAEYTNLSLKENVFPYFQHRLIDDGICLNPIEITPQHLNLASNIEQAQNSQALSSTHLTNNCRTFAFFAFGLEDLSVSDRTQFFRLLDLFQSRLAKISSPVVIWLDSAYLIEMIQQAPEFWLKKGAVFDFKESTTLHENLTFAQRYLNMVLRDPTYSHWRDRYTPLHATRVSESLNLMPPRQTLTESELSQLSLLFPNDISTISANQTILKKDSQESSCYILLEGEVEIVVPDSVGNEFLLDRLSQGDFFGEIALVKNIPRTATVKSVTDCKYIMLTKPKLRTAASKIANLLNLMAKIAEHRLEALVQSPTDVMSPLRRFASQDHLHPSMQVPLALTDLIDEAQQLIILGEAGAGKTTALQATMLTLAEKALYEIEHNLPVCLPIFIDLHRFTAEKTIEDLIFETLRRYNLVEAGTSLNLNTLFEQPEADGAKIQGGVPTFSFIFLIDGLNEGRLVDDVSGNNISGHQRSPVDQHDRIDQLEAINAFIYTFAQHRFVLTARTQWYTAIQNFKVVLLQPLTEREIGPFLVRYVGEQQGKRLAETIQNDRQLLVLAQHPLILRQLIQLMQRNQGILPKNHGLLFDQIITGLLSRNATTKGEALQASISQKQAILAKLAMLLHQNDASDCAIRSWQETIVKKRLLENFQFQAVITQLESSGLVQLSGEKQHRTVKFTHQIYQQFFVAFALKQQSLSIESYLNSGDKLQYWSAIIVLLYGISTNRTALFSQILGQTNDYGRIWVAAQCVAGSAEEIAVVTETLERVLDRQQHFAMLFSMGLASYLIGRYPEALSYLLQASEIQPGNAEVQYELGSLYRQVGQYERAITHLVAAIDLRPDFVDAYNQLGITYYNQEKYEEALTTFTVTTQLEPGNAYHYYNLGSIQKISKDYEAARTSFQVATSLSSDFTEAQIQLDILERAFSSGVVKVLRSIPMLSKLTLEQTIMLANRLNVVEHKAGDIVFHMGEKGDTFYIVERGLVEEFASEMNYKPEEHHPLKHHQLRQGDFFGETALLRSLPRTATVRCATQTRLLEINRADFTDIITHYPSIAYNLIQTSRHRLIRDRKSDRVSNPYYNPNYLQQVLDRQDAVTVLMGDIHGSTFLTNSIGPELMVAFLDEYLLRMSTIIVNAGGAVDKSLGDSVMGVFGRFPERAEETDVSPAVRSLLAGLQMRQAYLDLREEWKTRASIFMQTGMGIGINTGPVKIGTVGAEASMVGSAVNISSKLSKMAIGGRDESEIYIDQKTYTMLGDAIEVERLDPDYVLTKSGGVKLDVYRVVRNINLKLDTVSH